LFPQRKTKTRGRIIGEYLSTVFPQEQCGNVYLSSSQYCPIYAPYFVFDHHLCPRPFEPPWSQSALDAQAARLEAAFAAKERTLAAEAATQVLCGRRWIRG
jgi:hypothetical protein